MWIRIHLKLLNTDPIRIRIHNTGLNHVCHDGTLSNPLSGEGEGVRVCAYVPDLTGLLSAVPGGAGRSAHPDWQQDRVCPPGLRHRPGGGL